MFVQYTPKDGDAQTWDFVPDDVFEDDAELIEKHSGATWDTFLDNLRGGQARARRVLLWHLTRQVHPKLRFEDTPRFRMGELVVEFGAAELRELIDKLAKADVVGEEREQERQDILARLEVELTDALLREHATAEPEGKALSGGSGDAT